MLRLVEEAPALDWLHPSHSVLYLVAQIHYSPNHGLPVILDDLEQLPTSLGCTFLDPEEIRWVLRAPKSHLPCLSLDPV